MVSAEEARTMRTILIVDDEPANLDVLRHILRSDYRIKVATSGEAALEVACSTDAPDLVLMDIEMPGMGGVAACRALASHDTASRIPVLFVTSRDDPVDEAGGFAAGAEDYIHKPVNPHIVRARVKAHLELKAAREELERQNQALAENLRLREEVEAINRHDLKSPLTVVMNVPGLLIETENLTDEGKALLGLVADSGRRMLEMINRSIDIYKMENGTYVLRKAPVDALKVLRQVEGAHRPALQRKRLALEVSVCGGQPADGFVVEAEELLLYSMLGNLVANAAEASPEGARITVSLADGDSRTISIHNLGAIPPGIRGRFMQKFATAGKERGTGLGAYSARLIATTLGGDIGFQTSEETGTTVTVSLPRS